MCPEKKKKKEDNVKYYGVNGGFSLLYVELVSCFCMFAPNTKKRENEVFCIGRVTHGQVACSGQTMGVSSESITSMLQSE